MKNKTKNIVFALALAILGSAAVSYAEKTDSLIEQTYVKNKTAVTSEGINTGREFKLNAKDNVVEEETVVSSKAKEFIDEFKLSFGSDMMKYQTKSGVAPSEPKHIDANYNRVNVVASDKIEASSNHLNEFDSMITLNNAYQDNAIGFNEGSNSAISLTKKSGRLSIYGEYNQSNMPIALAETDRKSSGVLASARGPVSGSGTTASVPDENEKSVDSPIASDYYLEAIYSFKSNLKGKVSFKKSMIDSLESKENVKFEGVIDASKDVSIKAGYSTETYPEVETKNAKEEKVWTEFIMKF